MGWKNTYQPSPYVPPGLVYPFFHSELDQQYFTRLLRRNIWGQRGFVPTYVCPIHKLINLTLLQSEGQITPTTSTCPHLIWKYSIGSGLKNSGKFRDSKGICPILHLADRLTLFQSEGQTMPTTYPHLIWKCSVGFEGKIPGKFV